jgi:hypothetical protein
MNKIQKFAAGVLGLSMVLGAAASVASVASAQTGMTGTMYTRSLTVGSRGEDVTSLQTMLYAGGFLKVAPTGYFGALTKAALGAWQASVGISPAAGYFGPITMAYVNSHPMGGGSTVPGCMPGSMFSSTTGQPCTTGGTLPPGCTTSAGFSPTTGQSCSGGSTPTGAWSLDGSDGSGSASLSSYAGNTTAKKGETKDLAAAKITASGGTVAVTRASVEFSVRPWLYFSKVVLKDSNGNTIATKNLSSASDVTEVTVGSKYLVQFDGITVPVKPQNDVTLVVAGTVLATTDRLTSDVTVKVGFSSTAFRTLNGKGYTDTFGLSGISGAEGTDYRTATLTSSGSTGNILGRINPNTPAQRIQTTSTSGQTNDVTLGVFDFKAENQAATINTLIFTLGSNGTSQVEFDTAFKRVYLTDGTTVYNVNSVGTTSTFSNLNIALPLDTWKSLTLKADVADQDEFTNASQVAASTTMNSTNVVGVDANFNTLTVNGANIVTANTITFLSAGASVSNMSASATPVDNGSSAVVTAALKFMFTFNNTSNSDLYISKTPSTALATTSTVSGAASSTLTAVVTSPGTVSGDTSTYWVVPASTSRVFTYEGTMNNTNGTVGLKESKITTVYFDDDTTGLQESSINFGLEALRATAVI